MPRRASLRGNSRKPTPKARARRRYQGWIPLISGTGARDVLPKKRFKIGAILPTQVVSFFQVVTLAALVYAWQSKFRGATGSADLFVNALSWLPVLVRGALTGVILALCYLAIIEPIGLLRAWRAPSRRGDVVLHFVSAGLLLFLAMLVPPLAEPAAASSSVRLLYLESPVMWLAYVAGMLRLAAPVWRVLPMFRRTNALLVAVVSFLAVCGWRGFERWGFPDSAIATDAAIRLASLFSEAFGNPIHPIGFNEHGWPIYQTRQLQVVIAPYCSGLEGMAIISVLLVSLVFVERRRLYLGRAAALIALAAGLTFLLNALRLAMLFYIGDRWSSEVAVNGFHTNFGLVSLIFMTLGFTLAIRSWAGRGGVQLQRRLVEANDVSFPADVRLAFPLMVMIAVSFLTGLVTGEFNWLYPIPSALALTALWYWRLPPNERDWRVTALPLAIGCAVFFAWVGLVPSDPVKSASFAKTLFGAPAAISGFWLIARIVGSVLITPLAEELAFRGFLLPWVIEHLPRSISRSSRHILALLATAIGFGATHSNVIAGGIAGLAFGVVYLRRRSCLDAVLAHAAANFALCAYALPLGQWSYL